MAVRYSKYLPAFTFIFDLLLLDAAMYFVYCIVQRVFIPDNATLQFILWVTVCWGLISALSKSYRVTRPLILSENINRFLMTLVYHLVTVLGVIYFFQFYYIPRFELLISYALFFAFVVVERSVLFFALDFARKKGYNHREIMIIGDETISKRLTDSFSDHPEYGYDITGVVSDAQLSAMPEQALFERLTNKMPDELFICYKQMDSELLKRLFSFGEARSIKVKIVTDLTLNGNYAALINYHNIPVLQISSQPEISLKIRVLKRSFDLAFSLSVIVVGSPIFVLLYLVTWFSSKGPGIYRQERIGKNERPFYIYKFRSMYVDAERLGPQLSSANDPRITKWGRVMRRTRLDELPQFWNVLMGEMTVVGPRPERQYFIEQLIKKSPDYKKLLTIKPGLTSIGQVHYGYAENVDQMRDRVRYDLLYLKNVNFNHELDIIMKTVRVMVQRKGK